MKAMSVLIATLETGLLAIDAFSCGNTDPARIIEFIETELKNKYPKMIINRRKRVERFLTEEVNGGVRGFVDRHFLHFNVGALRDCAQSLDQFLNNGGRLMVTLAGAMSTAEIGASCTDDSFWENSCNYLHRANLEEDVFNLVAHSKYKLNNELA